MVDRGQARASVNAVSADSVGVEDVVVPSTSTESSSPALSPLVVP